MRSSVVQNTKYVLSFLSPSRFKRRMPVELHPTEVVVAGSNPASPAQWGCSSVVERVMFHHFCRRPCWKVRLGGVPSWLRHFSGGLVFSGECRRNSRGPDWPNNAIAFRRRVKNSANCRRPLLLGCFGECRWNYTINAVVAGSNPAGLIPSDCSSVVEHETFHHSCRPLR